MMRIEAANGDGFYEEHIARDVWLTRLYETTPVFHRRGEMRRWTSATHRGWSVSTSCGQEIYYARWSLTDHSDRVDREHGHHVPLRHAIRFGRPCKRCWP